MKYTEQQISKMAAPISKTEDEKCKNAIRMVRDAMKRLNYTDDGKEIRTYAEDSYAYALDLRQMYSDKKITILKSQYYDYAVKWQIDLQFGNTAKKIFEEYQENVSLFFSDLSTATLQKLSAIEDMMEDGNPERYSQVLTSCRRLWEDTARQLFAETLPDYKEKLFKTKTGKEIDVSGDHYNNKLSAVIETLQRKAAKNTLVGSEVIYLVDWIEQINNLQSSGVHSDLTREQAMQCIIHTYIALGDILTLKGSIK